MAERVFNTRNLIGHNIIVSTKKSDLKISGVFFEFFESNNSIVLKNYSILKENEEGNWDIVESGDILIIKGDGWVEIHCPKYFNGRRHG